MIQVNANDGVNATKIIIPYVESSDYAEMDLAPGAPMAGGASPYGKAVPMSSGGTTSRRTTYGTSKIANILFSILAAILIFFQRF